MGKIEMVFRVNKTKDYTTMSNYHFKEKDMSLKAIGMLSFMLSLPDEWNYSVEGLTAIRCESKNTINEILKELEKFGYLQRKRIYVNGKITNWEYNIYEKPLYLKNEDIENVDIENVDIDFSSQLNTNTLNTNKESKKEYKENKKEIPYEEIINYLNEQANTKYRHQVKETQRHIKARYEEGFTLEDFKQVIDKKCKEWLGTDMSKYLRPNTLFGTKFETYLNQERKLTLVEMFREME